MGSENKFESYDFYKLDSNGNKLLTDLANGRVFSFEDWFVCFGYTKESILKEIEANINFLESQIKYYLKEIRSGCEEYDQPEKMVLHFLGKLEESVYTQAYWEYTLEAAHEYFEQVK